MNIWIFPPICLLITCSRKKQCFFQNCNTYFTIQHLIAFSLFFENIYPFLIFWFNSELILTHCALYGYLDKNVQRFGWHFSLTTLSTFYLSNKEKWLMIMALLHTISPTNTYITYICMIQKIFFWIYQLSKAQCFEKYRVKLEFKCDLLCFEFNWPKPFMKIYFLRNWQVWS